MNKSLLIQIEDVSKNFGNTQALDKVNFMAYGGEIHAVLGENGAGKSTLVNIISGIIRPDSGSVKIFGEDIKSCNPLKMLKSGVATVFQNLSLIPDLTVSDNLFLHDDDDKTKYQEEHLRIYEWFNQYGIKDINPFDVVKDLSLSQRQRIEIIKAIHLHPKILILDEPTSALNPPEVRWLFEIIKKLKTAGVCIIYISHRIDEIRGLCNKMSILKNGKKVGTYNIDELTNSEIVQKMLGHYLVQEKKEEDQIKLDKAIMEIKGAAHYPELKKTDLKITKGEILGVAGLAGQGQINFFRILFGIDPCPSCTITINSQEIKIKSPIDAIMAGIAFLPAERNTSTMFLSLSVKQNMSIAILNMISRWGWLDYHQESAKVKFISDILNMNYKQSEHRISSLSGGNQQKALLGKWLLKDAKLYMLYDPTRGVDIGTKFEIIKFVKQMAKNGKTVIYYSTDISELVELSHRVIVFYQGIISDEFTGKNIKSDRILSSVTGIK